MTQEIRATVTSQQGGFLWMDSLYVESGQYAALTTLPDGCDMLNLLHLTVVNVECSDTSICLGDSAILSASVSLSESVYVDSLVPVKARPGDVLCDDGSLLPVGTFLASGKTPKGVVFHVDETGLHGLAIALQESVRIFTREPVNLFFSNLFNYVSEANRDLDGENNTLALIGLSEALNRSDYPADITAAGYCYYYDHRSLSTDISPRGWYLPSLGELNLLWSEIISVNQTLDQLLGLNGAYANVSDAFYWSSTLKNALFIWTSGAYNNIGNYGNSYKVRPITKF